MRESLKVPSSEVCYQEAVKGELCRLQDPEGKPPVLMGWWQDQLLLLKIMTQGHLRYNSPSVILLWSAPA